MFRRLAIYLTCIFLAPVFLLAFAAPAAAQNAAAVVQQIHDQAYSKCMSEARFGAGAELQGNCSCSADVVMSLLADEFKQAIASGNPASYQGPKLKGDELSRNVTLLKTCPKIGAYLQQQCANDAANPHCQVLQRALEQAQ